MVATPRPQGSRKFRRAPQSNAAKARFLRDVIANPAGHPEWSAERASSELARLEREKFRLSGRPQEEIDPSGGLRGGFTPSMPWTKANWERMEAFPPGGDSTLMIRCRGCGAMTPPHCVGSSGHCLDCQYAGFSPSVMESTPGSTSLISMARVRTAIRRSEQLVKFGI